MLPGSPPNRRASSKSQLDDPVRAARPAGRPPAVVPATALRFGRSRARRRCPRSARRGRRLDAPHRRSSSPATPTTSSIGPSSRAGDVADGRVEGVADEERCRDDGGAEQRADDDEHGLALAAGDVAQREPAEAALRDEVDHAPAAAGRRPTTTRTFMGSARLAPHRPAPSPGPDRGGDPWPFSDDRESRRTTTTPSRTCTRRSPRAPMARSWVTITRVWPAACTSKSSSSTASAVWLSRLPVGSSAHTIAGSDTRARAIATRCCSPPDSSVGRCVGPVAEPDPVEHGEGPVASLPGTDAGHEQRQLDVLGRGEDRDEVEALEDEPHAPGPVLGAAGVGHAVEVLAVDRARCRRRCRRDPRGS